MAHKSLLVAVLVYTFTKSATSSEPCPTPETTAAKVVLTSERTRTGHWLTQVDYNQGDRLGSQEAKNTARVSIGVEHIQTSASCKVAPNTVIRTTITVSPIPPGPDYELFQGIGYYKIHTSATMWARAREICAEEGTHLAIVNSKEEADVLKELMSRFATFVNATSNEYFIIGFHDHDREGHFISIFGDPLEKAGYLQWHGEEPNRSEDNKEDCGLIHRDGKLADVVCHWVLPFICEQEL